MIFPTPSSVRASLSLVWDAGSNHRFSRRLSRMSACGSFATPCTTLMRSNTTRRSAPITRSRLRSPTSKSMTTTLCPLCASAAPSAAVDVVLPTPPLPDVTTMTFVISYLLVLLFERRDHERVAVKPCLCGPSTQAGIDFFGGPVVAVDRHQLGFDAAAKDPRLAVSTGTRQCAAAQRAIDMNRPAGHHLGSGRDRAEHGHVAIGKRDRLP